MDNRLRFFDTPTKQNLDEGIVVFLVSFFSHNNEYVLTFKTAKDVVQQQNITFYFVCLFNNVLDHMYDLPSPGLLGCIVSGDDSNCSGYDIVVHSNSSPPQRISKLHPVKCPCNIQFCFHMVKMVGLHG